MYDLTVLGTLRADGTGDSFGRGINRQGLVVGECSVSTPGHHAFRWTPAGGMKDAGVVSSPFNTTALAVNAAGDLCGFGLTQSNGFARACAQSATGTLTGLPAAGGAGDNEAFSIADDGTMVGWTNLASGCGSPECPSNPGHAVRWFASTISFLPTLGGFFSAASGISPDGTKICGYGATPAGQTRGFRIRGAVIDTLSPLPGFNQAFGQAVNNSGHVVGYCFDGTHFRATLWIGNSAIDLGLPPGAVSSVAEGINATGTIVGYAALANGSLRAVRFSPTAPAVDLNSLVAPSPGDTLTYADDVNDLGQIVGDVQHGANTRAMVLTPSATSAVGPAGRTESALTMLAPQPNPVRTSTLVRFVTPRAGRARVAVVDVAGREVAVLLDDDIAAGDHALEWNARGAAARPVTPGVYFVRVRAGTESRSRTLVIAR